MTFEEEVAKVESSLEELGLAEVEPLFQARLAMHHRKLHGADAPIDNVLEVENEDLEECSIDEIRAFIAGLSREDRLKLELMRLEREMTSCKKCVEEIEEEIREFEERIRELRREHLYFSACLIIHKRALH